MANEKKQATKNRVKVMHMAIGLDLIGSKTSLHHRESDMEATAIGIRILSKKTKRIIVIPYSNVKGFELFPDEGDES